MNTRLEDLIQKASVAQPPSTLSRSSWTPYLPIIRILMEERAHTLMAAVEWLVGQGEIPPKRQGMAYRALRQILARRDAKRLRRQVELQRQLQAEATARPARRARARAVSPASAPPPSSPPSPGLLGALVALAHVAPAPASARPAATPHSDTSLNSNPNPNANAKAANKPATPAAV